MKRILLKSEKDLYELLDKNYNMIPDSDVCKAIYNSKEEQYKYQKMTFIQPTEYPCVMIYSTVRYNYSDRRNPHLYNKDYIFIKDAMYITKNDFE